MNVIELRNPLGGIAQGPHEISFNPLDHKIYVTDHQDRYVFIIDETGMSTSPVVTQVQVDRILNGVSFSGANNKMYVASSVSETTPRGKVFVLENGAVVDQIDVGYHPRGIAYNPANNKMYLTNQIDGTVSVIGMPPAVCACPGFCYLSLICP